MEAVICSIYHPHTSANTPSSWFAAPLLFPSQDSHTEGRPYGKLVNLYFGAPALMGVATPPLLLAPIGAPHWPLPLRVPQAPHPLPCAPFTPSYTPNSCTVPPLLQSQHPPPAPQSLPFAPNPCTAPSFAHMRKLTWMHGAVGIAAHSPLQTLLFRTP